MVMEVGERISEAFTEKLRLEDTVIEEAAQDDDANYPMLDIEDAEVVDDTNFYHQFDAAIDNPLQANNDHPQIADNGVNKKKKRKNNNRKNKRKNNQQYPAPGPKPFDLDRFVLGVCKRLREKKSYLVYTAVGVLGASAFGDLVKEVDAIQACGGQKTAEGNRYRTGGGILWNILKTRDPNAYREIMKKGRDFEKQFRRPWAVQPAQNNNQNNSIPSHVAADAITNIPIVSNLDRDIEVTTVERQSVQQSSGEKRRSVHDRIRVPVSYDDLPGGGLPEETFS